MTNACYIDARNFMFQMRENAMTFLLTNRQTNRQTDRQTTGQTDGETQTDRQTDRQTELGTYHNRKKMEKITQKTILTL